MSWGTKAVEGQRPPSNENIIRKARELFLEIQQDLGRDDAKRIFKQASSKQPASKNKVGRPRAHQFADLKLWEAFEKAGGVYKRAAELLANGNPDAVESFEKLLQRHIGATKREIWDRDSHPIGYKRSQTQTEWLALAILHVMHRARGD